MSLLVNAGFTDHSDGNLKNKTWSLSETANFLLFCCVHMSRRTGVGFQERKFIFPGCPEILYQVASCSLDAEHLYIRLRKTRPLSVFFFRFFLPFSLVMSYFLYHRTDLEVKFFKFLIKFFFSFFSKTYQLFSRFPRLLYCHRNLAFHWIVHCSVFQIGIICVEPRQK